MRIVEAGKRLVRDYPYSFITLIYWLVAGIIPLVVIFIEFKKGDLWWEYSKFYSPVFYYPLTFGVFAFYLSLRPIYLFLRLPKQNRFGFSTGNVIISALIISLLIFMTELTESPAILDIKPSVLASHPQAQKIINHFKNPPSDPNRQDYKEQKDFIAEESRIAHDREIYASSLNQLIQKPNNSSYTRWILFLSFYVQALEMLSLFWAISFFSMPKFKESLSNMPPQANTQKSNQEIFSDNLIHLSTSLCLSLPWIVMRIAFEADKIKVYGSSNAAASIIGIFYILAIIFTVLNLINLFGNIAQATITIIAALISIGVGTGILKTGVNFLGSHAEAQNFIFCFICVIIILFPWGIAYKDTFR